MARHAKETRETIIKLHGEGMKPKVIAEQLGCKPSYVYFCIDREKKKNKEPEEEQIETETPEEKLIREMYSTAADLCYKVQIGDNVIVDLGYQECKQLRRRTCTIVDKNHRSFVVQHKFKRNSYLEAFTWMDLVRKDGVRIA
jgi:hypothetical protein